MADISIPALPSLVAKCLRDLADRLDADNADIEIVNVTFQQDFDPGTLAPASQYKIELSYRLIHKLREC